MGSMGDRELEEFGKKRRGGESNAREKKFTPVGSPKKEDGEVKEKEKKRQKKREKGGVFMRILKGGKKKKKPVNLGTRGNKKRGKISGGGEKGEHSVLETRKPAGKRKKRRTGQREKKKGEDLWKEKKGSNHESTWSIEVSIPERKKVLRGESPKRSDLHLGRGGSGFVREGGKGGSSGQGEGKKKNSHLKTSRLFEEGKRKGSTNGKRGPLDERRAFAKRQWFKRAGRKRKSRLVEKRKKGKAKRRVEERRNALLNREKEVGPLTFHKGKEEISIQGKRGRSSIL